MACQPSPTVPGVENVPSSDSMEDESLESKPKEASPPRGIITTLTDKAFKFASSMRTPSGESSMPSGDDFTTLETEPSAVTSGVENNEDMEVEGVVKDTEEGPEPSPKIEEPNDPPTSTSIESAPTDDSVEDPPYGKVDMARSAISDTKDIQECVLEEKIKKVKVTTDTSTEKRLFEALADALDNLHESISSSLLVMRKEEANSELGDEDRKKGNHTFAKLRDAAVKAYHSLVIYGSDMDLSAREPNGKDDSVSHESDEHEIFLSENRRTRLSDTGKKLWMTIRSNPDLFNDLISDDSNDSAQGGDFILFERKKHQAVAGGYTRAIAARIVFLNYIDTRCSIGCPPTLNKSVAVSDCDNGRNPSVQELSFGLKIFSRAGRAILEHNRDDGARASHDTLSLAIACFDAIKCMAESNGDAADELRRLLDEAFDSFSLLANAASALSDQVNDSGESDKSVKKSKLRAMVLMHLKQAESFLEEHCHGSCNKNGDDNFISKFSTLRRYLPSLARLCYKHGSKFAKIEDYDNANGSLHIALKATDCCLNEIRRALEKENDETLQSTSSDQGKRKGKGIYVQVLHNLEAELVVVSIEAFYVLSNICVSTGKKEQAIICLDQIEKYLIEQQDRDEKLFCDAMSKLGQQGKQYIFSEGSASAIAGPKEQDKADIRTRAQNARANAKRRHVREKATLAFSRIMVFHNSSPSSEDELLIDKKLRELVDLAWKFKSSGSDVSSAHHAITAANHHSSSLDMGKNDEHIFNLMLRGVRLVQVRRMISNVSGTMDPYKTLLEKFPKSHFRRPFILLDQLNSMLSVEYQVRERKVDSKTVKQLDAQVLQMAKEFVESASSFFEKASSITRGNGDSDTTLFVSSTQSLSDELFSETKMVLSRAVSLYHSTKDYDLCANFSDMLVGILQSDPQAKGISADETLGSVLTIKAFSLSMCGNYSEGMKSALKAWDNVKNVDSLVTLFHCAVRYELEYSSCDPSSQPSSLLEFDNALSELITIASESGFDEILDAFPRLSNVCVSNEAGGGGLILLGVQQRWITLLIGSKKLHHILKDKTSCEPPGGHAVFEIIRAYLENFEHCLQLNKNHDPFCEDLLRLTSQSINMMKKLRDRKQHKSSSRRKKRKKAENESAVLIWDDPSTSKICGDRSDLVWIAEQLWNIGNCLMASLVKPQGKDLRGYASHVFAASHDYCLLSEELEGAALSKGNLCVEPDSNMMLPTFSAHDNDTPCDITSEFSGQCLLLSAATAVDYASSCIQSSDRDGGIATTEIKNLLRITLHRLYHAQQELHLNCQDETGQKRNDSMVVLLTLRCAVGIGEDSLGVELLKSNGLSKAICESEESLRNVFPIALVAMERNMSQTSKILWSVCACLLKNAGKFQLDLDDYSLSLGEIHRKMIQLSSTTTEVMLVYADVDMLAKKHRERSNKDGVHDDDFYSQDDVSWLTIDAYNRGVNSTFLGYFENAEILFATALNLLPFCGKEVQCHAISIRGAYQKAISMKLRPSSSFLTFIGE